MFHILPHLQNGRTHPALWVCGEPAGTSLGVPQLVLSGWVINGGHHPASQSDSLNCPYILSLCWQLSYSKEGSVQGLQVTWGEKSGRNSICNLSAETFETQHFPVQVMGKPMDQQQKSRAVDKDNYRMGHPASNRHALYLLLLYVHMKARGNFSCPPSLATIYLPWLLQ